MNPIGIRRAIKAFIRTYESELVDGLESSNIPKKISQILLSRVEPKQKQGIAIGITSPRSARYFDAESSGGNTIRYSYIASGRSTNEYFIEIHVRDYAQRQAGETVGGTYEPFEKEEETFWEFMGRLEDSFRKYTAIPPESGSHTIEVYGNGSQRDREISAEDLSQRYVDSAGSEEYILYGILRFQVGTCGEPNALTRS